MGNMSLKVLEKSLNFLFKKGTNPVKYKQRLAKYPDEKKNLKLDIANGFIGFDCEGRHLVLVVCNLHSVG